jgi:hypothetical protein
MGLWVYDCWMKRSEANSERARGERMVDEERATRVKHSPVEKCLSHHLVGSGIENEISGKL